MSRRKRQVPPGLIEAWRRRRLIRGTASVPQRDDRPSVYSRSHLNSGPPLVEVHAHKIADWLRECPLTKAAAAELLGLDVRSADFERSWDLALHLRDGARGTDR